MKIIETIPASFKNNMFARARILKIEPSIFGRNRIYLRIQEGKNFQSIHLTQPQISLLSFVLKKYLV